METQRLHINQPRNSLMRPKKTSLVLLKSMMMGATEKWIQENPDGTAAEFKRLPPHIFNEIRDNNTIADAFLDSKGMNLQVLMI